LKVQGGKLRVFKVRGGYFKKGGSSGGFTEISPKFKLPSARIRLSGLEKNIN
jgi:hypothetical protein